MEENDKKESAYPNELGQLNQLCTSHTKSPGCHQSAEPVQRLPRQWQEAVSLPPTNLVNWRSSVPIMGDKLEHELGVKLQHSALPDSSFRDGVQDTRHELPLGRLRVPRQPHAWVPTRPSEVLRGVGVPRTTECAHVHGNLVPTRYCVLPLGSRVWSQWQQTVCEHSITVAFAFSREREHVFGNVNRRPR